jgi:hypothetical protein
MSSAKGSWTSLCTATRRWEIVQQHLKCGQKVVKVGEHEATSAVDVTIATPTFDDLSTGSSRRRP